MHYCHSNVCVEILFNSSTNTKCKILIEWTFHSTHHWDCWCTLLEHPAVVHCAALRALQTTASRHPRLKLSLWQHPRHTDDCQRPRSQMEKRRRLHNLSELHCSSYSTLSARQIKRIKINRWGSNTNHTFYQVLWVIYVINEISTSSLLDKAKFVVDKIKAKQLTWNCF